MSAEELQAVPVARLIEDEYDVQWSTQVRATSLEEAARKALGIQRGPHGTVTGFRVFNRRTGQERFIDVEQDARAADDRSVDVYVGRSAGADGAVLVIVDTVGFEPDGSGDGPALRVLVNDGDVYEGAPFDNGDGSVEHPLGEAPDVKLSVPLAAIAYPGEGRAE